ncbi:MAG: phage tail sheath C-terminal domain-containing protein [Motiliproteus sp.]
MIYKTPGVYVEEISAFPPSVAEVETAIPAFIGYTEKAQDKNGASLTHLPRRIRSLVEYEQLFGGPARPATLAVTLDASNQPTQVTVTQHYQLYYSLRLFFDNGGGDCYIVSVADYAPDGAKTKADLEAGIDAVQNCDEPTLLLFPEAALMGGVDLSDLQKKALEQCRKRRDRFCIFDLEQTSDHSAGISAFRNNIGINDLKYGAAYTPHLHTTLATQFIYQDINLLDASDAALTLSEITAAAGLDVAAITAIDSAIDSAVESATDNTVATAQDDIDELAISLRNSNPIYAAIVAAIQTTGMILPPSGAVAGAYAKVDNERGVWKAPANVSLTSVKGPTVMIDNADQASLNIDVTSGKSINAIRSFPGKGTLIWGARTLAGNDREWRYIPVQRFFIMAEESIRRSTEWAVFEANDAALWVKLKSMIENYLTQKWREGALAGSKPKDAFYVNIGLSKTMTAQDILEGRLIIEIGMAVIRSAEFIPLKITHKMQAS